VVLEKGLQSSWENTVPYFPYLVGNIQFSCFLWLFSERIGSHSARNEEQLQKLVQVIQRHGGKAFAFPLDVTKFEDIPNVYREIRSANGPVDIVIANAGISQKGKKTVMLTDEETIAIVNTNLTGAILTIKSVVPDMIARNSGHIVGISSLASYRGLPTSAVYGATKAGLNHFLEALRVELLQYGGITVTEICPGYVKTPILQNYSQPTPFLIPVEEAARQIINALVAKKRHHGFPWIAETLMSLVRWLPSWIYEKAVWLIRKN
jgi:short-subunit dehydrogenase